MNNYGKIIDRIKGDLSNANSQSRNKTISVLLDILRENVDSQFVMKLVYNGIINDLIQNVNCTNRRELLECIQILVKTYAFYTNGLVDETIKGITNKQLIDSEEEAVIAINIILTIITNVFEFTETQVILLINKHKEGLLNLIEQAIFRSSSIYVATKLFIFVIHYSTENIDQSQIIKIESIYNSALQYLMTAKDISDLEMLKIICKTSLSLVKFNNSINEDSSGIRLSPLSEASSVNQISEIKKSLIESVQTATIKYFIPLAKSKIEFRLQIDIETADILIEFLEAVIKLKEIQESTICVELLNQGYLKHLLKLSLDYPERPSIRRNACRLISRIIVKLKEYLELSIDDWRGGSSAFESFLCTGLESLPVEIKEWEGLLKNYTYESNSLLILLFCHFIGTNEKFIFTQESLGLKLTSIMEYCKEPIIFRAIWLLYSVASLDSKIPASNRCLYKVAMKNLVSSLHKQGNIQLTYTHHADLLLYSIKETDFPEQPRLDIISLWLENSTSKEEFDVFIQGCIEQNYDESNIVNILMNIIHKNDAKNLNNVLKAYDSLLRFKEAIPEEVVELVWKILTEDLECFIPSHSNLLKTVLRMTSTLPISKSIPAVILRRCSKEICKVLIQEETDTILKILLITAAAFAIRQSIELNDFYVADSFLKNKKFLKNIHASGFSLEKIRLTEICFKTLSLLMGCQIKYNLQSKTVAEMVFEKLAILLMNLKDREFRTNFIIELIKFLIGNKIENPVIRLRKLTNNSDLQHIYNIYLMIHIMHSEISPSSQDETYECLSIILNYCSDEKLNIQKFLTCPSTPLLMELAIQMCPMTNRISCHFLDFATTWLAYLNTFLSQNDVRIHWLAEESAEQLERFSAYIVNLNICESASIYNFLKAVFDYQKNIKKFFPEKDISESIEMNS